MRRPVHGRIVLLRHQQGAGDSIQRVTEAITVEVHQGLGHLALDRDVGEDHFVDAVEIPLVVRRHLIDPLHLAGIHIAGPDAHGPFIVTGALRGVPGAGVAATVVHQVQVLVVAVPAPGRSAADLPLVFLPGAERRICSDRLNLAVFPGGGRVWIDQHFVVGTDAVAAPNHIAGIDVVSRDVAAHAPFAAGNAGNHLVLEHMGGIRIHRTERRIAVLDRPDDLAGLGIQRDQHGVRLLQEHLAFGIGQTAIHRVAAHLRNDGRILLRLVFPLDGLGVQVHREHLVRESAVEVHHVADHQRRPFVAAQNAGGKRPCHLHLAYVARIDLVELAVALVVHVASLHGPVRRIGDVLFDVGVGLCDPCHGDQNQRHCQVTEFDSHLSSCLYCLKWNEDFTEHCPTANPRATSLAVTAHTFQAHAFREEITPNVCGYNSTVDLQGQ